MQERKKIIVVGANGAISKEIIPLLIKNFEVYSMVRSPPEFGINSMFLKFIEGDALEGSIWDEWLEGVDAVVSCFGVRAGEAEDRHLQFVNLVIEKMKQKGVKRFIGFFSHGAMKDQSGKFGFEREGFPNKGRGQCHSQCIQALEKSELNFTAICLWKLQQGAKQVSADGKNWSESVADSEGLVTFLSSQILTPTFSRSTVFVGNKP